MKPADPQLPTLITPVQMCTREELELRIEELTDFIENAALPLHWVDGNGIIVWANQAELDLLGYSKEEYIGAHIADFHADDAVINDILTRLTNNETLYNQPSQLRCKDGSIKHVLINSNVLRKDGRFVHTRCFTRDITYLKQAEEKSSKLAAIVESSDDAIISKTLDGIITSWNKSAERMFGYTEQEILGQSITILIPEDRLHEEELIISKVINGEKVEHFESIRLKKDKTEIPVSLTISPIRDSAGAILGVSKIARDISKQKVFEDRLQRYADNVEILNTIGKQIFGTLDVGEILQKVINITTVVTDADFGVFFYNESTQSSSIYYKCSGKAKEVFELFFKNNEPFFKSIFNSDGAVRFYDVLKEAEYENAKLYHQMKNQLPFLSYLSVPLISKSGLVIGGLLYGYSKPLNNITEHEGLLTGVSGQASGALDNAALYEQVRKLNSKKDEFIGLASHELKTPVTSLQGYLQIVYKALPDNERIKNFIHNALKQTGKLSRLISDLLDVSKIETGQIPLCLTSFDLVAFVKELIDMMQYTTKSHQIVLNSDLDHLTISADKDRIERVIINLLSNAIKYSPKAKLVNVSVSRKSERVRIAVQDFGIGIKEEHHADIFSRFYRVEEIDAHISGLGVGLYISKQIISQHNGNLLVESEPGKGSTFTFELPVNQL